LRLDGFIWDRVDNLIVTLEDGSEDTLFQRGVCLDLETPTGFLPQAEKQPPPRYVSDYDFQLVWESDPRPYGMDRCAAGDLDNDGISELVTWWKEYQTAPDAYILIYKSSGNNEYTLFMEEPFYCLTDYPSLSQMLITDLDQNGQRELIYTLDRVYIWEFSQPGVYLSWNSSILFSRAVADVKVCDVNQNGIPELAFVTSNYGMQPPTMYMVQEFSGKFSMTFVFWELGSFWQEWEDDRLAVGDFDNDGVVDMVSGNFASVWSPNPIDVQYFRYDTTATFNFEQNWLYTGIPLSCATPVIADLDSDGENDLFAGGLYPHGGSAHVWEATGFGVGYVAWQDTTSLISAPNESVCGLVDQTPAVGSLVIYWNAQDNSILYLFGMEDLQYSCLWQSASIDSVALHNPTIFDIEQDGKMNIAMGSNIYGIYLPNKVFDWEQTGAGVESPYELPTPETYILYPAYPNPLNSATVIPYSLPWESDLTFTIYDLAGRQVWEERKLGVTPGINHLIWNATGLHSGVYMIRLGKQMQKLILLK